MELHYSSHPSKDQATDPDVECFFEGKYQRHQVDAIDQIQQEWICFLATASTCSHDRREEIVLCLREAMLNALSYGCPYPHSTVSLKVIYQPQKRHITIKVIDEGKGCNFDVQARKNDLDELSPHHLGLVLIDAFANEVHYDHDGCEIHMIFNLDEKP